MISIMARTISQENRIYIMSRNLPLYILQDGASCRLDWALRPSTWQVDEPNS